MWKEIKIDDIAGIEEFVGIWNNKENCTYFLDEEGVKETMENREDAHCYIFIGNYIKLIMLFKHDVSDNTTYIFIQNSDIEWTTDSTSTTKGDELWDAYRDFILMLLNQYNRPVKMVKWEKTKRVQHIIDLVEYMYSLRGIKATNLEELWHFELM